MSYKNINTFYQFIGSIAQGGNSWVDAAEQGQEVDGVLTKAEFRVFLNKDYLAWVKENGLGDTTKIGNDIVNKFWGQFDTDVNGNVEGTRKRDINALNKEEVAAVDAKIQHYVQVGNWVNNNVKAPNGLTGEFAKDWKIQISDELRKYAEELKAENPNITEEELNAKLAEKLAEIRNQVTAECFVAQYMKQLQNGTLKGIDYRINDDALLMNTLIPNMIKKVLEANKNETDQAKIDEAIKTAVESMFNAYIKTAGLGEGSDYDLASIGYNANTMNDIQKAVFSKDLQASINSRYAELEKYGISATPLMEEFLNNLTLADGETFEKIANDKTIVSKFEASSYATNLKNAVEIIEKYMNIEADASQEGIYKILVTKFGEKIASVIQSEADMNTAYKGIITNTLQEIMNGKLSVSVADGFIMEQIAIKLDDIYPQMQTLPIKDLNTIYTAREDLATQKGDLNILKDAAISYCRALCGKENTRFKDAVKEVFGNNYETSIGDMSKTQITEAIKKLQNVVQEIGDISTFKINNWDNVKDMSIIQGCEQKIKIGATILNDKSPIDTSRITYSANISGNGSGSINAQTGELTIKAENNEGKIIVKLQAYVDGIAVGDTKLMTITINTLSSIISGCSSTLSGAGDAEVYNAGTQEGYVKNKKLNELYEDNAVILLYTHSKRAKKNQWEDNVAEVTKRLTEVGTAIVYALSSSGLDKSLLTKAMQNVRENYISSGPMKYEARNVNIRSTVATLIQNDEKYANRIVEGRDSYATDRTAYEIRFRDFVDMILEEYKKLNGASVSTKSSTEINSSNNSSGVSNTDHHSNGHTTHICSCGWEYDPEEGAPEYGIAPGTPFEDIPDDFCCPNCAQHKDAFLRYD